MHIYSLNKWQHVHNFTRIDPANERGSPVHFLIFQHTCSH